MDRRSVLKLVATLSAGSLVAPQLWAQGVEPKSIKGLDEVGLDALRDLARAYESFDEGDTAGVEQMVERLRGTDLSDGRLIQDLQQEMRDDFQSGRLAVLHGWHVSRTEARVLAAAAKLLA